MTQNEVGVKNIMEKWKWYWSHDGEDYIGGPFETRDDAIYDGKSYGDPFFIIEAIKEDLDLSLEFDADEWLEDIDDQLYNDRRGGDPDGDGLFAGITTDQVLFLEARVRQAIHNWQTDNDLKFDTWHFSDQRNGEFIERKENE